MSEPVNPLFEEEKEFLERKKLEYERALRGDVEHLKEQGAQVGKVALIGVGVAGGIWLLSKALGGRKRRRARAWHDADDQHADNADYHSQYFADLDDDDERWDGPADHYFGGDDQGPDHDHGAVYHTDTDRYDDPTAFADDENDEEPYLVREDYADGNDLPYDDSRRLPEGNEFQAETRPGLGSRLLTFAKSDLGKAVLGQALSVVAALATKALSDHLSKAEADTAKNTDLAASTAEGDGYAHGHPATPQPAAPDVTFAPDAAITYREPLA